jgi:hypothetical protein
MEMITVVAKAPSQSTNLRREKPDQGTLKDKTERRLQKTRKRKTTTKPAATKRTALMKLIPMARRLSQSLRVPSTQRSLTL